MQAVGATNSVTKGNWGKRGERYDAILNELLTNDSAEPINVSFRQLVGPLPADDGTHSLYPYPARLVRHIPRLLLNSDWLAPSDAAVVDPFCGSGTVLVEAQKSGRHSFGIDQNPIGALISRAKTTPLQVDKVVDHAEQIIRRAKKLRTKGTPPEYVAKWYTPAANSALSRISLCLDAYKDEPSYDLLRVIFALTSRGVARTDQRIPVPVRSTRNANITTADVWALFEHNTFNATNKIRRLPSNSHKSIVAHGDSRSSTTWSQNPFAKTSVMLTSPPYGAAQKYIRSTSLEAGWLGFTEASGTASLERKSIGRERLSIKDREFDLSRIEDDELRNFLFEVRRVNPLRADIYSNYFIDMTTLFTQAIKRTPNLDTIAMIAGTNVVTNKTLQTHDHLSRIIETLGFRKKLVLRDEIRGRTLLTTRNSKSNPAAAEYVHIFTRQQA